MNKILHSSNLLVHESWPEFLETREALKNA
jgi:hypothetical protein